MNTITQTELSVAAGYPAAANDKSTQSAKTAKETQASATTAKKTSKYTQGKTIGEPELSEKAKKYFEQLKKKYAGMDFILVSADKKEQAQANAAKYANPNRMVVLIDEEKIERMAEDEAYRKQYEGIISGASRQLPQIKESLGANGSSVTSFGMKVNDNGTASFFAVIDKSLAAQKDRIEKKAEQKAKDKKAAQKAAQKERTEERIEEKRAQKADERKAQKGEKTDASEKTDDENTITVTASSVDELLRKINDTIFAVRSEYIRTDSERQVGQNFDFAI